MDVDKKVPYGSPRSRRVNQVKTSRNASGAMIQQDTPTAFSNAPPPDATTAPERTWKSTPRPATIPSHSRH